MRRPVFWRALNRSSPNFKQDSAKLILSDPDIKLYPHIFGPSKPEQHWSLHSAGIDPPAVVIPDMWCYYKMNNDGGYWYNSDIIDDSSGHGNSTTVFCNPSVEAVAGKVAGTSAKFVQNDPYSPSNYGYLETTGSKVYTSSPPLSYQIWFRLDSMPDKNGPIAIARGGSAPIAMPIDGIGIRGINAEGADPPLSLHIFNELNITDTGIYISIGTWYHLVVVVVSPPPFSATYVYLDNVLVSLKLRPAPSHSFTSYYSSIAFGRGMYGTAIEYTNITVDDFAIWTKALSEPEIDYLWNSGAGRELG